LIAPLREIARALGHARKNGAGGYVCSCPCHDDQHASLSLSAGRDGKLLFRCHAGCDQEQLVDEFKKRGWLNGAGPDRKREIPRGTQARIVETYRYTDDAGELLYEVLRYEPKDFKQRRPDGRGGWIWSLGNCRRVLYRLPELLDDLAHERTIFIAEGERKVDLLRSWNLAATCNSGGASKWLPEYSELFHAGDDVIILPDNDAPGRKHVKAVAASLASVGVNVRVLELPKIGPKGDIVNWAAVGGTPEQFHTLVDRDARPWVAPEGNELDHDYEPPGVADALPPAPDRNSLLLSAWRKREIPPRDYLLGGVMCTTSRLFVRT
jgi:putative DNA primase/helicase